MPTRDVSVDLKNAFSTRALLILLVGNAVLLAVALLLPELIWLLIGAGVLVTLAEWAAVRGAGAGAVDRALAGGDGRAGTIPQAEPAPVLPPPPPRLERPAQPPEAAAVQVLALLQRQGRLIDFLQEDLRPYEDAQIGAAVRAVHEGCRQALAEHVTLEPVMDQPEGSTVTLEPGFDAHAVRLAGYTAGDPPFRGELRHRGWRVSRIELPELMQTQDRIVAPAEVEVAG